MSEKRENFLKSLKPDDGNRVFAAINTSGRTREEFGKAEIVKKAAEEIYAKAEERNTQAKEDIKNWNLAPDAAMVESSEAKDSLGRAKANLAYAINKLEQAQKDIDDSKASVR